MARIDLQDVARQAERKRMNKDNTWDFLVRLGMIKGNTLYHRNYDGIKDAWKDEPCYIVGGGPSLKPVLDKLGFGFLDGKHTIGINHVIEDYDGFEWFFFLDKRFIEKTTYDLDKYHGLIFAQCTTGMPPALNVKIYHCRNDRPSSRMEDGLYNANFSGIAALNLAIISGANPIYLLGYGNGVGATHQSYHYKRDYTGENKLDKNFKKYCNVQAQFSRFREWQDRIIHVTDGNDVVEITRKIKTTQFCNKVAGVEKISVFHNTRPDEAKIVHLSFSKDKARHNDITRYVMDECIGKHELHDINAGPPPVADLYIGEHFLSTSKAVNAFDKKNRCIDIVHTAGCIPERGFSRVVALTEAWKRHLGKHLVKATDMIYGGIDLLPYQGVLPTDAPVFGRMTRWSPGKIHPDWNRVTTEILTAVPEARCLMYTEMMNASRPMLKHAKVTYSSDCKIDMFKGDFLKNMSVYVHANGSFKETLSFAVIEAMATGLPVVYLKEGTGVLEEVTDGAGIPCNTINDVRDMVVTLLKDKAMREYYGKLAKEQAQRFDKNVMVKKFNEVIKQCLKK